jgi:hypothetical protein
MFVNIILPILILYPLAILWLYHIDKDDEPKKEPVLPLPPCTITEQPVKGLSMLDWAVNSEYKQGNRIYLMHRVGNFLKIKFQSGYIIEVDFTTISDAIITCDYITDKYIRTMKWGGL